jgi:hypothetical protein
MFTCDNAGSDDYSFIDQDLQGKIGGVTWKWEGTENGGLGEESLDGNLDIEIYGIAAESGDPCHPLAFEATSYKVFFTITVAPVNAVGLYEGHCVTMSNGVTDYICSQGTVEILSVSATPGELVTGRVDANLNDNSTVNGNFTVTYCL